VCRARTGVAAGLALKTPGMKSGVRPLTELKPQRRPPCFINCTNQAKLGLYAFPPRRVRPADVRRLGRHGEQKLEHHRVLSTNHLHGSFTRHRQQLLSSSLSSKRQERAESGCAASPHRPFRRRLARRSGFARLGHLVNHWLYGAGWRLTGVAAARSSLRWLKQKRSSVRLLSTEVSRANPAIFRCNLSLMPL
jgi:hypothetical protein